MTTVTEETTTLQKGFVGQSIPRKEDRRLVQGEGQFFDDIRRHGMGYVHFVRSPYAHARIVSIDVSAALALDDVYGTITGDEVAIQTDPFFEMSTAPGNAIKDYALAVGKVRHMGEPVAAVCAATRELARDAAELVEVEYEELPVLVDGEEALKEETILHDDAGSNVVWSGVFDWGDVDAALAEADHVVKIEKLHFHRFSSTPLECAGALVEHDRGTGEWTIHCNHQMPGIGAIWMAPALRVGIDKLRFVTRRHRRRLRQQDLPAPAVRRALPARAEARPPGAVDGVAHRPAHGERARQRADVPRRRGRREGRRHDDGLQGPGDRRLRRFPALRAARLHHLGAGHTGLLRAGGRSGSTSRRSARTSRRCRRTAATPECSTSG